MKNLLKYTNQYLVACLFVLTYVLLLWGTLSLSNTLSASYIKWYYHIDNLPYATHKVESNPTQQTVFLEYARQATRANWSMSQIERGWSVLKCESKFVYNAKNPNSTATGVAQWIIGTWKGKAPIGSDRLDYRLNISLFIQYFITEPSHWSECL